MNDIRLNEFFKLREFDCPCCHTVKLKNELLDKLSILHTIVNQPIYISSGYRCPSYNLSINGDINSYHMKGMAADIYVKYYYLDLLFAQAQSVGFTGIGIYSKKNFLHLDVRPGPLKVWRDPSA